MRAERRGTRRESRYDFEYGGREYQERGVGGSREPWRRRELRETRESHGFRGRRGRRRPRGGPRRWEERRRRDSEWEYGGRDLEPVEPIPDPWGGFYPPVSWGGGMLYGLEGGGPSPFALFGPSPYDEAYDTHLPPEEALRRERLIHEQRRREAAARARARRYRRERARRRREGGRYGAE